MTTKEYLYKLILEGQEFILDELNINKDDGYMISGDGYWLWTNTAGSIVTSSE